MHGIHHFAGRCGAEGARGINEAYGHEAVRADLADCRTTIGLLHKSLGAPGHCFMPIRIIPAPPNSG